VVLEEEISCERCHGASEEHLRRPVQGSIINSAKLTGPTRDSICEQCHLAGVTQRILNPSKEFDDFRPASDWKMCYRLHPRGCAGLQSDQPLEAIGTQRMCSQR
jgi:hypothetical protein